MAGQQAYYWSVMHASPSSPIPGFVKAAVTICSSAKTSPHNATWLEGAATAMESCSDFHDGQYREKGIKPEKALKTFSAVCEAWLTSAQWFAAELWRELGCASLEEYLKPKEPRFIHWDPLDLLCLTRMWQKGDIGDVGGKGDWKVALAQVGCKVMVMPCRTDQYFTVAAGEEEARCLGENGVWCPIESIWGHFAGGGYSPVDVKFIDGKIAEFLAS